MPKRHKRIVIGVCVLLGIWYAAFAALIVTATFAKAANKGAIARCDERTPRDAWGYTIEWEWGHLVFTCSYQGRDYRFGGAETQVGVTESFG